MANELSDALHELRELRETTRKMDIAAKKVNIAICEFASKKLGNMNFESNEEAIEYIMSFYEDEK